MTSEWWIRSIASLLDGSGRSLVPDYPPLGAV
jgi:hypothetical protein